MTVLSGYSSDSLFLLRSPILQINSCSEKAVLQGLESPDDSQWLTCPTWRTGNFRNGLEPGAKRRLSVADACASPVHMSLFALGSLPQGETGGFPVRILFVRKAVEPRCFFRYTGFVIGRQAMTEYIDIYTKDHIRTGRRVPRTAHLKIGEYRLIVHVCLFNAENKMLRLLGCLLRRPQQSRGNQYGRHPPGAAGRTRRGLRFPSGLPCDDGKLHLRI